MDNKPITLKDGLGEKIKRMNTGTKIAAGTALGSAAIASTAYAAKKLLAKRKAKKEADAQAENLKECMIDLILNENHLYISDDDMQFLLEACDYELSEEEILENITNELNEDFKFKRGNTGSGKANIDNLENALDNKIWSVKANSNSTANELVGKEGKRKVTEKIASGNASDTLSKHTPKISNEEIKNREKKRNEFASTASKQMKKNIKKSNKEARKNFKEHNKKREEYLKERQNNITKSNIDKKEKDSFTPKPVEVATENNGALEKIKQFGKDHKKELAIAGALAGTAAAAGVGYHLYKKHKAKKEAEEQNKSESFSIFIFDEEAYITESTMDMLLEACDYELSEEEILENIEYELNENVFKNSNLVKSAKNVIEKNKSKVKDALEKNKSKVKYIEINDKDAEAIANALPIPVKKVKNNRSFMEKAKGYSYERQILGVATSAAVLGGAYYLNKKHKQFEREKNKMNNNSNKSESFSVFVFDEEAYITESTMDMLLEACDYELTESEILDNIENELNEDGQIFNESLTNAFYDAVKSGDVQAVRIMMKNSLLVDPTFKQFEEMQKAASGLKGLFDPHDGRNLESNMNAEMVRVVNNFSHERINHLKKVVRQERPIDKVMSKVATSQPAQPTQVNVAKKGSTAMDKIRQFGKDHKKGLKIAGAIAGTAALAGGAYYLHKKHKEKKAKEREEANKSESFSVFVFDEEAYITESTMDMLLEACDYELSEEEILDNIIDELNENFKFKRGNTGRGKANIEDLENDFDNKVWSFKASPDHSIANKIVGVDAKRKVKEKIAYGNASDTLSKHTPKISNKEIKDREKERIKLASTASKQMQKEVKESNKKSRENFKEHNKKREEYLKDHPNNITKAEVAAKNSGALEKIKQFGKDHKKELAIAGALAGTVAAAGIGYGAYRLHKKNKAKKEAEKQNKSESFDVFLNDGEAYITESTMDMLLEACDYELSEEEILENIGIELNEELLDEGLIKLFNKHRLKKAEEQLKKAKEERKSMEERYKGRDTVKVKEVNTTNELVYDHNGELKPSTKFTSTYVYKSVRDLLADKDEEIDRLEDKIKKLKSKLNEAFNLLDEDVNSMKEARKLSNLAISNFTSSLKKAKNDDSMFKDSICRDLSKGNKICIQLFELGCQQLELGSAKEIDDFIDNKIIPDLKKLVELLKTKTNYNIRLHSSEDNFAILMCGEKINESALNEAALVVDKNIRKILNIYSNAAKQVISKYRIEYTMESIKSRYEKYDDITLLRIKQPNALNHINHVQLLKEINQIAEKNLNDGEKNYFQLALDHTGGMNSKNKLYSIALEPNKKIMSEGFIFSKGFRQKLADKNKDIKEGTATKQNAEQYKDKLIKERARLTNIAYKIVNSEFKDLKKGARTSSSYDIPSEGMYMVMEFDQYDIIENFRENYGSESHKLYEKVSNIASKLNNETNSNLFRVKIDNGGDWDDPLRIYLCLKANAPKLNLDEDTNLDEGSSFTTKNMRLNPTQRNLREFKARQRQLNNKSKVVNKVPTTTVNPNLK